MKNVKTLKIALITFVSLIFLLPSSWAEEKDSESTATSVQDQTPGRSWGRGMGMRQKMMRPTFEEADANKDGKITDEELNKFRAQRQVERAKEGRMMRNADKALSFKELDKNNDGALTPGEYPPPWPPQKQK